MYDVIVIGGGTAGCFAAICAAKQGAETLLVEKTSLLGGTMTAARVNYPGLFFAWGKQIVGGPCLETLLKAGAPMPPSQYPTYEHWKGQIHVNEFDYLCTLEETCEQSGVKILYHTMPSSIHEKDDCVKVVLTGKEGLFEVYSKILIDASGDANAVTLAGYPTEKRTTRQPATLINDITGYDVNDVDVKAFNEHMERCVQNGMLSLQDSQGGAFYYHLLNKRISMHIPCDKAETSYGRTQLEITARKKLQKILQAFRKFPGLENVRIANFAIECGVRESVRIVGETQMTIKNYLSGEKYKDAICYCFYPVDEHLPTKVRKIYHEEGVIPTIPYTALIPKNSKRILAVGRIISSDPDTNSAIRVQAPCMATGQVAGVAAAIASRKNVPVLEIPFDELKTELNNLGAIVP